MKKWNERKSIQLPNSIIKMNTIETIEYGMVSNSTLLKIFGDEMSYNELKFYAKDINDTTYLKVEWNRNKCFDSQLVRVWFNESEVMDKKYSLNHSCDMFVWLGELEVEAEDEDEEEGIRCFKCDTPYALNSREHDEFIFNSEGEKGICSYCYKDEYATDEEDEEDEHVECEECDCKGDPLHFNRLSQGYYCDDCLTPKKAKMM